MSHGEPYVSMELKDENDPDQEKRILAERGAVPGSGLFEIDVATLREFRLRVTYEPEYGERHFGVWGLEEMAKKEAVRVRRKLSFRARVKVHTDAAEYSLTGALKVPAHDGSLALGGERETGPDVVAHQLRKVGEAVVLAYPGRQIRQDIPDGDAGDDRRGVHPASTRSGRLSP